MKRTTYVRAAATALVLSAGVFAHAEMREFFRKPLLLTCQAPGEPSIEIHIPNKREVLVKGANLYLGGIFLLTADGLADYHLDAHYVLLVAENVFYSGAGAVTMYDDDKSVDYTCTSK